MTSRFTSTVAFIAALSVGAAGTGIPLHGHDRAHDDATPHFEPPHHAHGASYVHCDDGPTIRATKLMVALAVFKEELPESATTVTTAPPDPQRSDGRRPPTRSSRAPPA